MVISPQLMVWADVTAGSCAEFAVTVSDRPMVAVVPSRSAHRPTGVAGQVQRCNARLPERQPDGGRHRPGHQERKVLQDHRHRDGYRPVEPDAAGEQALRYRRHLPVADVTTAAPRIAATCGNA